MPPKRRARSRPGHPEPRFDAGASACRLVKLFEQTSDRDAVERMLLALAVHPDGVGLQSATLLAFNARSGTLVGRGRRERSGPEAGKPARCPALGEALEEARRLRPRGIVPAADQVIRSLEVDPRSLTGAPGEAWLKGVAAGPACEDSPWAGASAVGAALLRMDGEPHALLVGNWDDPVPPVDALARLGTLVALAELGLVARRRAGESPRRARQIAALSQMARAAVSTLNVAEAMRVAVEAAARACDARGSALWVRRGDHLRLEATHGFSPERDQIGRALQPLAEHELGSTAPRVIQPVTDEALVPAQTAAEMGTVLIAPLVAYEARLGVLAVYHLARPEGEDELRAREDLVLLGAIADQVAVCLDQAGRFEELRDSRQREREQAVRLRRAERLATLGDVALRAAQEARNPLASIGAFARRMQRALDSADPNREYLEIIVREAGRLERLLQEQAEYLTPEAPALKVESVNQVVQDVLHQVAEKLVRRRIRLLKRLAPEMPPLLLDRTRIQRVLDNVMERALDSTPVGGRIRVESRRVQQYAVVEISHGGTREPGAALDQLFVPFASARSGGPAVGLAVAQQVVREHGGEIRVRGDGDWSVIVTLTLPIRENQDRRRTGPERRRPQADRRAPVPAE